MFLFTWSTPFSLFEMLHDYILDYLLDMILDRMAIRQSDESEPFRETFRIDFLKSKESKNVHWIPGQLVWFLLIDSSETVPHESLFFTVKLFIIISRIWFQRSYRVLLIGIRRIRRAWEYSINSSARFVFTNNPSSSTYFACQLFGQVHDCLGDSMLGLHADERCLDLEDLTAVTPLRWYKETFWIHVMLCLIKGFQKFIFPWL